VDEQPPRDTAPGGTTVNVRTGEWRHCPLSHHESQGHHAGVPAVAGAPLPPDTDQGDGE
jgi:hypothetical protein